MLKNPTHFITFNPENIGVPKMSENAGRKERAVDQNCSQRNDLIGSGYVRALNSNIVDPANRQRWLDERTTVPEEQAGTGGHSKAGYRPNPYLALGSRKWNWSQLCIVTPWMMSHRGRSCSLRRSKLWSRTFSRCHVTAVRLGRESCRGWREGDIIFIERLNMVI